MADFLTQQRSFLAKRWLHSHEEDTAEEQVYRPADYPFRPSRGRTGFDLSDSNQVTQVNISPVDKPYESSGQWQFRKNEAGNLILTLRNGKYISQQLQVVSIAPDKLVVLK